jgi:hypothetical protein
LDNQSILHDFVSKLGRNEEEKLINIAKNHGLKNETVTKETHVTDLINLF